MQIFLISAENVSKKYGISQEDQDKFATESQQTVKQAHEAGCFVKEIFPITVNGKDGSVVVHRDEPPQNDNRVEVLQRLKPAFQKVNIRGYLFL